MTNIELQNVLQSFPDDIDIVITVDNVRHYVPAAPYIKPFHRNDKNLCIRAEYMTTD